MRAMRAMRAGHWVVSALTADCTSFLVHWKIVTLVSLWWWFKCTNVREDSDLLETMTCDYCYVCEYVWSNKKCCCQLWRQKWNSVQIKCFVSSDGKLFVRKDIWSGITTGLTLTGLIVIILHEGVSCCSLTRSRTPQKQTWVLCMQSEE